METIIKKLFEAHRTAMDKARKTRDLFGLGEPITIAAFHDAFGIETAFEIVAGMSTTDYLIRTLQAEGKENQTGRHLVEEEQK